MPRLTRKEMDEFNKAYHEDYIKVKDIVEWIEARRRQFPIDMKIQMLYADLLLRINYMEKY